MKSYEIIGLMTGDIPFTDKTLSNLSDMIKEYPYFQMAHVLHTLNLLHLKDSHFLFDLRKTAIYTSDRKKLFFRMKDAFFIPAFVEIQGKTGIQEKIKASAKEEVSEQIENPVDSSFDLIDDFLSKMEEKAPVEIKKTEIPFVSSDYISYLLSEKTENPETPPLQQQETIDKFLETEAVTPVRIKIDAPEEPEKTQVSLSDKPNGDIFFSETLAKIYIKQKKYDKALEIIHKLNLIYPEKNRYFADQIRFLEKLVINTNKN